MSFELWKERVDTEVRRITRENGGPLAEVGADDLPDYLYRDAYDAGIDPHDVAVDALDQADYWLMISEG